MIRKGVTQRAEQSLERILSPIRRFYTLASNPYSEIRVYGRFIVFCQTSPHRPLHATEDIWA